MRVTHEVPVAAAAVDSRGADASVSRATHSRREFLAGATAVGVTLLQPGFAAAAPAGAKTFKSVVAAVKAGCTPAVLSANASFAGGDANRPTLQALSAKDVIRRYMVIERGGLRFGSRAACAARVAVSWRVSPCRDKITRLKVIPKSMNTLTIKIPAGLDAALAEASARAQLSKSELVRRAVTAYLVPGRGDERSAEPLSALAIAGDLVGCFAGGPADLASNPRHLDGFGQR